MLAGQGRNTGEGREEEEEEGSHSRAFDCAAAYKELKHELKLLRDDPVPQLVYNYQFDYYPRFCSDIVITRDVNSGWYNLYDGRNFTYTYCN